MNREEAIKIFQLMKKILSIPNSDAARTIEAIDMAIDALTHEIRTETHGVCLDLISRADAIEAVKETILKRFNLADWYEEMLNCGVDIEDRIKALPSAEAVPRLKQTDTLIIADALRYLAKDTERHLSDRTRADALRQQFLQYGARMKGGAE